MNEETDNAKIIIRPIVAHMVISDIEKNTAFPLRKEKKKRRSTIFMLWVSIPTMHWALLMPNLPSSAPIPRADDYVVRRGGCSEINRGWGQVPREK